MIALSKKVCLLGDFAVGKTSLVRRFVYDMFDDKYISTIGVKVSRKTISLVRDEDIVELTMMLWDLAGSEEFSRMRASYLRGTAGALLVCDVMRPETLSRMRNVVSNAHKYTPSRGRIHIGLSLADTPDELLVAVKDTGVRIPAADQPKLSNRFFRVSNANQMGALGTGLGLHLARLLVDLHGGRIWFESSVGQGMVVFVTCPIADHSDDPVA